MDIKDIDPVTLLIALILQNRGGLPLEDTYVEIASNLNMTPYYDKGTLRLASPTVDLTVEQVLTKVKK